ncbi:MAG: sigma-70 family RNA polymerase sigma factor [Elusimicrobia bacterium]|nr:sigma-70 family RNA polymerase sigma factor [Elusimicrobiota bacterium]
MTAPAAVEGDALAAYIAQAAKTPLLDHEQEIVLGRELRERRREFELLMLGSPIVWRQLLSWEELVRSGEMSAAELMPRGYKSPAAVAGMRRRLASACRPLRRALARPGGGREKIVARLDALKLNPKKLQRLAGKVQLMAARLADCRSELAGLSARYGNDFARPERYLRRRAAGRMSAAELRELAGAPDAQVAADMDRVRALKERLSGIAAAVPGDPGELLEFAQLVSAALDRMARARTDLVKANILLAVSVAKRFTHSRMEMSDLVQEGTLGLMKAADRYDERLGFKFSTYATWWVRQSIQRAIADKAAIIRLPAHVHGMRDKMWHVEREYRERHGREPTAAELARRLRMSPDRVRAAAKAGQDPLSLSAEPGEGEDFSLADRLADDDQASPGAAAHKNLRTGELEAALGRLSEREAEIVRLRFGLGVEDVMTLGEVGKRLGLTRERIRQIEKKAIEKLKAPALSGRLKDYWETEH